MKKPIKHICLFNEVHIAPDRQIGMHSQQTWELSYVMVGEGVRTVGDCSEPFSAGEVVLIPPAIPHCWQFDEHITDGEGRISNITLTFDSLFLDHCILLFPELGDVVLRIRETVDAVKFSASQRSDIIALLETMKHENKAERIASVVRLLVVLASCGKPHVVGKKVSISLVETHLSQIKTYVACNSRRAITIADVARHVGMNRSSFCTFFRHTTGKSFVSYLNEYRLTTACELLQRQDAGIAEICYLSGFNDIPYFNRLFKRTKGLTPREYRLAIRTGKSK
jgi:AraC-like DNA-binding protein